MTEEIIENENIYVLKKVKQEFVNVIVQAEDADASNYLTFPWKERLQEKSLSLSHPKTKRN